MTDWHKETLRLKEKHGWKAKPGYKIFVADQGALRFDVPQDWILDLGTSSFKFYDLQPPDDNCTLEVSLIRLPPIDWSGLPLSQLILQAVTDDDGCGKIQEADVRKVDRPDLEMVWAETTFIDRIQHKKAHSRICLARGSNLQVLITFAFWAEDASKLSVTWDEVLRSMQLGVYVKDPTVGPTLM
jgi:hypothetical protein